jgi:hypothetical protein
MPVPVSLISTLNSVKKAEIIVDSFEVWPNGTTDFVAPEGWTAQSWSYGNPSGYTNTKNNAGVNYYLERGTSGVTDQLYSVRFAANDAFFPVQNAPDFRMIKSVDATNVSTMSLDVYVNSIPDVFEFTLSSQSYYNYNDDLSNGHNTITLDVSTISGVDDLEIRVYGKNFEVFVDNLKLIP